MSTTTERHIHTVLGGLILAALLWVGGAVLDFSQQISVLQVQVAELTRRLDEKTGDRYRGDDAKRDFALRDQRLGALEQRVSRLEAHPMHSRRDAGEDTSEIGRR